MMRPDLLYAVLCDDVRQEITGKFIFVGVTHLLHVPNLPSRYPKLCVATCWSNGDGSFRVRNRLMGTDMTSVVAQTDPILLNLSPSRRVHVMVSMFQWLALSQEGSHWVEVLLDDDIVCRYPLWVKLLPRPAQGPAPLAEA